jgi:integrase
MLKVPSHIQLNRFGIYYFRVAIPLSLHVKLGRKELKRSLKTSNRKKAIQLAREYRVKIDALFEYIKGRNMDWIEIASILNTEFKALSDKSHKGILKDGPIGENLSQVARDAICENARKFLARLEACRDRKPYELSPRWADFVDTILKRNGVTLDKDSDDYRQACIETTKMITALEEKTFNTHKAFSSYPLPVEHQATYQQAPQSIIDVTHKASPLLSEVINKFITEKERVGAWTEKSTDEYRSILDLFIRVLGDVQIGTIRYEQARDFKEVLLKLPPNINKSPLYRTKTIDQIVAMKPVGVMAMNTVIKKIRRVSSLFLWAKQHGYVYENYFGGLCPKNTKRAHEERDAFSADDLSVLFPVDFLENKKFRHPYSTWLPLIAIYSGCRLEEICQLHICDIRQDVDIWVFDINGDEDKKLKTEASDRLIPIHSQLIELGFLDYVQSLRRKKVVRLFPELKPDKYGSYGASASKWFSRYKTGCGITISTKAFHSFRHTVANHLKQKGIEREKIAAILGHKDESMTTGRYGKPYESPVLVEVLMRLKFDLPCNK